MRISLLFITNVCIFGSVLKRLFYILMLLVYIPAVAGVGFSTHYCFGEAGETHVFSLSKHPCCCSSAQENEDHCCTDEIKLVKLEDNQQHSQHRIQLKPIVFDLFYSIELPFVFTPAVVLDREVKGPEPPPLCASKNILYCCYRI